MIIINISSKGIIAHAKQTRSLKGYGNVVGQDFGDSSGFGILKFLCRLHL